MAVEPSVHSDIELLDEYRRRQMLEHLTGPMISLVLHVVLIVAGVILLAGKVCRVTLLIKTLNQNS